jgi:hypothetical protein
MYKFWPYALATLFVIISLTSCTQQNSQTQVTPTSTASQQTPTATPQTAVWVTLSFTVVNTEWKGDVLRLRLRAENIGNKTITFSQVFYAYEDSDTATRMCQSTLQNLWATYEVGDVRSESIYFVLPPSSSDVWLAIGAAKIIKIPHKSVLQALPATQTDGGFVFTLKNVQWTGNAAALSLSIENTNNSQGYIQGLGKSSSSAPGNALCIISTSSMQYGIPPTSATSDWYTGAFEAGDIRSGTIYFDVAPCAIDLYLQLGNAGDKLFEIYR